MAIEKSATDVSTRFLKGVEFVSLNEAKGNKNELENLFKTWLLDSDIDHEHLRICLHKFGDSTGQNMSQLKCDIAECLINPLSIPFGHRYQIQMDFCSIQLGGSGITKSIAANDMPIYELEVIACLSSSSICQSQLFGQPFRLYPTQCWSLDWEKLQENQQLFAALCKILCERDQYLLTRLKRNSQSTKELRSYFILESDGSQLLVNAAVPAELVLPSREFGFPCLLSDGLEHNMLTEVTKCLNQLPLIQEYQPYEFSSGLYSALSNNLQHNTRDSNSTFTNGYSSPEVGFSSHPALESFPPKLPRNRNKRSRSFSNITTH